MTTTQTQPAAVATDAELRAMSIPARNALLDQYEAERYADEYDADAAYERHLENVLYDENRAFEAWEASMGVTGPWC